MSKIHSLDSLINLLQSGVLTEEARKEAMKKLHEIIQLALGDKEDELAKFVFMKAISVGVRPETLADFLNVAEKVQPGSSVSIMIPYVAEYFNKKRIQECEAYNYVSYFYGISKRNGKVARFENNDIKRRDVGGWFVSYEDAVKARKIFEPILDMVYGKQQED